MSLIVPNKALLVVCDGSKAVFYRNTGTAQRIALEAEQTLEEHHPPTRELGTDRPGRSIDAHDGSRSAVEGTDWHEVAEAAFLRGVAEAVEKIAVRDEDGTLILAAPPRALGILREQLGQAGRRMLRAELGKDLVRMPKAKLEDYLQAEFG